MLNGIKCVELLAEVLVILVDFIRSVLLFRLTDDDVSCCEVLDDHNFDFANSF